MQSDTLPLPLHDTQQYRLIRHAATTRSHYTQSLHAVTTRSHDTQPRHAATTRSHDTHKMDDCIAGNGSSHPCSLDGMLERHVAIMKSAYLDGPKSSLKDLFKSADKNALKDIRGKSLDEFGTTYGYEICYKENLLLWTSFNIGIYNRDIVKLMNNITNMSQDASIANLIKTSIWQSDYIIAVMRESEYRRNMRHGPDGLWNMSPHPNNSANKDYIPVLLGIATFTKIPPENMCELLKFLSVDKEEILTMTNITCPSEAENILGITNGMLNNYARKEDKRVSCLEIKPIQGISKELAISIFTKWGYSVLAIINEGTSNECLWLVREEFEIQVNNRLRQSIDNLSSPTDRLFTDADISNINIKFSPVTSKKRSLISQPKKVKIKKNRIDGSIDVSSCLIPKLDAEHVEFQDEIWNLLKDEISSDCNCDETESDAAEKAMDDIELAAQSLMDDNVFDSNDNEVPAHQLQITSSPIVSAIETTSIDQLSNAHLGEIITQVENETSPSFYEEATSACPKAMQLKKLVTELISNDSCDDCQSHLNENIKNFLSQIDCNSKVYKEDVMSFLQDSDKITLLFEEFCKSNNQSSISSTLNSQIDKGNFYDFVKTH